MEEEDDTDDKKDKVERQHKAAEEGKQGGVLTCGVHAGTSKDTDNKEAQQQGSEVFQMNSETKVLEAQAQNDIKEGITQNNGSASDAGESSSNTGASCSMKTAAPVDISRINNNESKPHRKEAVYQNWPPEPLEELQQAEESALEDIRRSVPPISERLARLAAEGALDSGRSNNTAFSSDKSSQKSKPRAKEPVYQNWPPGEFQQPQESEERTLPRIYVPSMAERAAILAAGGTLVRGRTKEEYAAFLRDKNKPKPPAKEPESEQSTLKENSASGSLIREHQVQLEEKCKKSVTKAESKHCGSPKKQSKQTVSADIKGKQTHTSGTKPETSPPLSQRQSQPSKGQKSVQTLRQAGKENQQKEKAKKQDLQSAPEGNKIQQKKGGSDQAKSDQKLKTEEKQTAQAKEGKKQTLSQKEQRPVTKPVEIRKTEKREQKLPASQNSPSKKSPVHRKEQTSTSPKRNPPPQTLPKEKQSNLVKKVRQKGGNASIIKNNESKGTGQQQATENLLIAKNLQNPSLPQSTAAHPSVELQETSGKGMPKESTGSLLEESNKEVLKEYKKQEDQAQETNKLTEKKSLQEKKNEIKKQKQQNENKIPQKSGQSKAPMQQKKEESSALEKQAQRNRGTNAMQQELKDMDKKSSEEQCLTDGKEVGKLNRNIQNAVSNKEKSSKDAIHSIRKQYQKLCKEELMKQQLLEKSVYSPQPAQKEEKVKQQQKPEVKSDENKLGMKENLNQLAKKKMEDYEDDKGLGCGGIQGSSCPIYFGVRSYLHHFYDTTPLKNPQLYEECAEEDDFEYAIDPVKTRGCRKCCQGFWFRAGLWGGINLILVGMITFLVGYLTPQREIVVGQQGDLEILDRSAIMFNHRLELCRLAALAVFCCGGMVLFVVLFISTLLHVKGHNNNEGTCCAENIYYHGYMAAPLVEPFVVTQDLSMPPTTAIKIPIIEEIKSVQPNIWPEMGTVRDGSRVGQMP